VIEPTQSGNGALLGAPRIVTKRFYKLNVAVGSRAGEFDKHAISLTQTNANTKLLIDTIVPLQIYAKNTAK